MHHHDSRAAVVSHTYTHAHTNIHTQCHTHFSHSLLSLTSLTHFSLSHIHTHFSHSLLSLPSLTLSHTLPHSHIYKNRTKT